MGLGTRGIRRPYGLGARRRWHVHVQRPVATGRRRADVGSA